MNFPVAPKKSQRRKRKEAQKKPKNISESLSQSLKAMQAKIKSFFKPSPSSSSPIPTTVKSNSDDDGLALWEKNQNVIVNTYQRRTTIAHRSDVLKECDGKLSRKGSKNLQKKRSYTQFHLELGQRDFLLRQCKECGVSYAPGDELDEKNHQSFHKSYMNGITFKGWQNERAFVLSKSRVVMVSENDSPAHRNKVQEVVKMMEVELGEDWILHQRCTRIAGCLVAEPIKEAFKLIALPDDEKPLKKKTSSSPLTSIQFGNFVLQREVSKRCRTSDERLDDGGAIVCEEEAKPALCGIRAIWVSPSNRRKGVATKLLDTTRESFSNKGCVLEKSELAFSQPSSMGRAFGSKYFGTCSFLVYKPQITN